MTAETPTVLVVEDEQELADTYAAWLADSHDVRTAYDGESALEMLDGVDVALLDRRLPGATGDDVLTAIRERGDSCQVAMVTAVEPDFDVFELGFDDYVVKPMLRDELEALVERLRRRAAYDQDVQRHFALASKLATLEEHRSEEELRESEEYARVKDELAELTDRLAERRRALTEDDYVALFRSTTT